MEMQFEIPGDLTALGCPQNCLLAPASTALLEAAIGVFLLPVP